jgi:hypothetical protein
MKTAQKVAAFVVGLVVVFAAAVWAGRTIGPAGDVTVAHGESDAEAAVVAPGEAQLPGGLQATQDGYTLDLADSIATADKDVPLQFRILDGGGAPVTSFVESHEKLLHLIVVRNDLAAFQHVHPVLGGDGTWRTPLNLSRAGDYRVFADFTPAGGPALTLGANLHVAGAYDPQPLPIATATAEVDGYTVTLNGTPNANQASMLTLSVRQDGKPVADLQPYLGAYGHLVALRASDLAYLHVHPAGEPGDGVTPSGPQINFHTTFPSAGEYRLFLDFRHRDVVRTAQFTVTVADSQQAPPAAPEHADSGHGH